MEQSRRKFLLSGWKLGGSLLAGAAGYTAYEALRPLASGGGGGVLNVGERGLFPKGTATYFPEGRLYVANVKGDLFALSQKCPHLGCQVPFCESSGRFECPCHGSIFDLGGEYIAGPSPRGLDRYPLEVRKGEVVIDTRELTAGPSRGVRKYFEKSKGPSCIEGG